MVQREYKGMRLTFETVERTQEVERLRRDLAMLTTLGDEGLRLNVELARLLEEIRQQGECDEAEYLEVADRIIALLAPRASDREAAQAILSLTRLHFAVGRIIDKYQLADAVAKLVAELPDDFTRANRVLWSDLFYHHHLWEAHRKRRTEGWNGFIDYLKGERRLWTDPGWFALRSIVRDAIYTALPRDDQQTLLLLQRELGSDAGVAKMIARRLAELAPTT
jgi:hypothetical protein